MEMFFNLIQQLQATGQSQNNWTESKLSNSPDAVALIEELLRRNGITELASSALGGSMSLVVEIPDKNEVLRVVDVTQEKSSAGNPLMLQPVHDYGEVLGFRVQVFPKVKLLSEAIGNGSISKADALEKIVTLDKQFKEMGLLLWDCKVPNLCITDNNEIRLLDFGAVCPLSERYGGKIGNDTHSYDDKYKMNIANICKELKGNDLAHEVVTQQTDWVDNIVTSIKHDIELGVNLLKPESKPNSWMSKVGSERTESRTGGESHL